VSLPAAYDTVRYAGAVYLLFLAWKSFKSNGIAAVPTGKAVYYYTPSAIFRQGVITNILNPKMALFVLALFPQFVRPEAGSVVTQIMVLATVLNVIGLVVNGIVILAASKLSTAIARSDKYRRLPQMLLGTVFVGLAARLAFDNRR